MKAAELLDEIVKTITGLGDKPLVSDMVRTYKAAEKIIEEEMNAQFNDGYEHRKKCEEQAVITRHKNQN